MKFIINYCNMHLSKIQSLKDNIGAPQQESGQILYKEDFQKVSGDFEADTEETDSFSLSTAFKTKETHNSFASMNGLEVPGFEDLPNISKPILYEQCCDLSEINCEEDSLSCCQEIERKDFAQYSFESLSIPHRVQSCVKVYSHKRRKSATNKNKSKHIDTSILMRSPVSTDCIDLSEEPLAEDIPLRLLTSLDMESAEYIISLSTENIQSSTSKYSQSSASKYFQSMRAGCEEHSSKESSERSNSISKPILRRSLRLNQEDETICEERDIRKSTSLNETEFCTKGKRKSKKNRGKNLTSIKLLQKNHQTTAAISDKARDEEIIKVNEVSETIEMDSIFKTFAKENLMENINRALWGDMSDFSEDFSNNRMNSLEHKDREIPFAVGLLPLRTALEKMQATPDYQPRKTRSSMNVSIKHDSNSLKRGYVCSDKVTSFKKQNSCNFKQNAKTVCHIEIRTASTQFVKRRSRKYLQSNFNRLGSQTIVNKQ
ncbi:uncharacterized protein LOC143186642 [Calliopsis andreniformis]|uniref:uncharacterized protein LOC143186642 n=1 Tax=Calliopsis andreniformis TaxID=337506 RepID=UPI003FCE593B